MTNPDLNNSAGAEAGLPASTQRTNQAPDRLAGLMAGNDAISRVLSTLQVCRDELNREMKARLMERYALHRTVFEELWNNAPEGTHASYSACWPAIRPLAGVVGFEREGEDLRSIWEAPSNCPGADQFEVYFPLKYLADDGDKVMRADADAERARRTALVAAAKGSVHQLRQLPTGVADDWPF